MRKTIGEYNSCFKKLYESLKKRFKLNYEETLDEVDKVFEDENFWKYPVILISNDDTYSMEFINELNDIGEVRAYGFYDRGSGPYLDVFELRDKINRILENEVDADKFFYVSVSVHSFFRLDIPGTICIKQGRDSGNLSIDILKTRVVIENEKFRKAVDDDYSQFDRLYRELNYKKWEMYPELFKRNYGMTINNFYTYTGKRDMRGIYVYEKDSEIVGFIILDNVTNKDGNLSSSSEILIEDIYVVEKFRRRGIARIMYEEIVKIIRKRTPYKIKFKVWDCDVETKGFVSSLQSKSLYSLYELEN